MMQMVFQSPSGSFNPRERLGKSIEEPLLSMKLSAKDRKARAIDVMASCGLTSEFYDRFPHEVSGGQCQRAAIARALITKPALLILDEATSALDVTVQAQIIELLLSLRDERGLSYLFICHDMALVQQVCDYVLVMHDGRIVEEGEPGDVILSPADPYTKNLIASVL